MDSWGRPEIRDFIGVSNIVRGIGNDVRTSRENKQATELTQKFLRDPNADVNQAALGYSPKAIKSATGATAGLSNIQGMRRTLAQQGQQRNVENQLASMSAEDLSQIDPKEFGQFGDNAFHARQTAATLLNDYSQIPEIKERIKTGRVKESAGKHSDFIKFYNNIESAVKIGDDNKALQLFSALTDQSPTPYRTGEIKNGKIEVFMVEDGEKQESTWISPQEALGELSKFKDTKNFVVQSMHAADAAKQLNMESALNPIVFVNPKTNKRINVIRSLRTDTNNVGYEIFDDNGRLVDVTEDPKYFTKHGFKKATAAGKPMTAAQAAKQGLAERKYAREGTYTTPKQKSDFNVKALKLVQENLAIGESVTQEALWKTYGQLHGLDVIPGIGDKAGQFLLTDGQGNMYNQYAQKLKPAGGAKEKKSGLATKNRIKPGAGAKTKKPQIGLSSKKNPQQKKQQSFQRSKITGDPNKPVFDTKDITRAAKAIFKVGMKASDLADAARAYLIKTKNKVTDAAVNQIVKAAKAMTASQAKARKQSFSGPGYGKRKDGTKKGKGFLGELKRPDGRVSTELSIGVTFDGKETEIPTLIPTLTQKEITLLLRGDKPTREIVKKSVEHAKKRIRQGKSPFKEEK